MRKILNLMAGKTLLKVRHRIQKTKESVDKLQKTINMA